jgi:hypothetical protein
MCRDERTSESGRVGLAAHDDYARACAEARAAASVFFALGDDPLTAALEAIYEAQAAVDDVERVSDAVVAVLDG